MDRKLPWVFLFVYIIYIVAKTDAWLPSVLQVQQLPPKLNRQHQGQGISSAHLLIRSPRLSSL